MLNLKLELEKLLLTPHNKDINRKEDVIQFGLGLCVKVRCRNITRMFIFRTKVQAKSRMSEREENDSKRWVESIMDLISVQIHPWIFLTSKCLLHTTRTANVAMSKFDQTSPMPYEKLLKNLDVVRSRLARPLTLSEKVLYAHLDDPQNQGEHIKISI